METERIAGTYIIEKPGDTPVLKPGSFTTTLPYHQAEEPLAEVPAADSPAPAQPEPAATGHDAGEE